MGVLGWLRSGRSTQSDAAREEQARSLAELQAGRLPLSAQARLAAGAGAFTSDLSSADLVSLRAAGYEPVGQVFGSAVISTAARYYRHPAVGFSQLGASWQPPTRMPGWFDSDRRARSTAIQRLLTEVRALGADGAIALRTLPNTLPNEPVSECSLLATAVRSPATPRTEQPFLTELDGPAFAALRRGGYAPAATIFHIDRYLVCGLGMGFGMGGGYGSFGYRNEELTGPTQLMNTARASIRRSLAQSLHAYPGAGMLLHSFDIRFGATECTAGMGNRVDYLVDGFATATAVVPAAPVPAGKLTFRAVVPL